MKIENRPGVCVCVHLVSPYGAHSTAEHRKSEPATHVGGPDPEVPDVVLVPRVILELPRASLQEVELLLKSGASGKEQEFCRQIAGRAR